MPLPAPRKGTGPVTGKVKPTRAEQLLEATRSLATEQIPEEHTMSAIEGPVAPPGAAPLADAVAATGDQFLPSAGSIAPLTHQTGDRSPDLPSSVHQHAQVSGATLRYVQIGAVRPSPFQPKGRPSKDAMDQVRRAIADASSLEFLVSSEGAAYFSRLAPEAARLAELAYDVATHGVKTPIELRLLDESGFELLAGHRRLAAATLAGLATVPALDFGEMSNAAAAATVLRGNLHRENFTTWQEAVLVAEVQERRKSDGHRDTVRTIAAVMGWSHGKVNMLLRIRRALPVALFARIGDGDAGRAEEALARASFRELERLANIADDGKRVDAARQLFGWETVRSTAGLDRAAFMHRPKRGGGYIIDVREPVESMTVGDATVLKEVLEAQLVRVRGRLDALRGHAAGTAPSA